MICNKCGINKCRKGYRSDTGKHFYYKDCAECFSKTMSRTGSGVNNPFYGKKHSDKSNKQNSKAHLGKTLEKKKSEGWKPKPRNNKNKKCKYCDTTENLKQGQNWGAVVIYNVCVSCYAKNMSKKKKGHIVTDETRKKLSEANTGHVCSDETKQKLREINLGNVVPQYVRDKISINNSCYWKDKKRSKITRDKISKSKENINSDIRKNMRLGRIRYIEKCKNNGEPISPTIGRNETKILNKIEKENNVKLIRQYRIRGYFVDGYDKENNIVYEVDERHHLNNIEKDLRRQEEIIKYLNCKFIRIKDY